jgi:hypothetical protein
MQGDFSSHVFRLLIFKILVSHWTKLLQYAQNNYNNLTNISLFVLKLERMLLVYKIALFKCIFSALTVNAFTDVNIKCRNRGGVTYNVGQSNLPLNEVRFQ